jgi:gliding motility-associated-like protein
MWRCFLILFYLVVHIKDTYSQKEGNIGIFGNGVGLDFNSSPPEVFVLSNNFNTEEKSASISDKDGNLLFYTNGVRVFNRDHQQMPNGSDLTTDYGTTSTQMAIVPIPESSYLYYIFTPGYQGRDLTYSLIDMRLNEGLGGVVFKDSLIYKSTTEKISVVKSSSGKLLWVITHEYGTNVFRTFKVTTEGLDTIAVKSAAGTVHKKGGVGSGATGYLKASPSGNRLALGVNDSDGALEVFDFEKSTGKITNPFKLYSNPINESFGSYGVEFSPDESKLYQTRIAKRELYQYDLSAGNMADIINSATLISSAVWGAVQLAPDGKIYMVSKRDAEYLDVIEKPNEKGIACQYVKGSVYLKGKKVILGLPVFSYDIIRPEIIQLDFCENEPAKFTLGSIDNVAAATWTFGDPVSGIENSSNLLSPSHVFKNAGIYLVSVEVLFNDNTVIHYEITITIFNKPVISIGTDRDLCVGATGFRVDVATDSPSLQYRWQNGNRTSWYNINSPGTYWVKALNEHCATIDTLNVFKMDKPVLELADTVICKNTSVFVSIEMPGTIVTWDDGHHGESRTLAEAGIYSVNLQNQCGTYTDSFIVSVLPDLKLDLGADTILCKNESITLDVFSLSAKYRWNNESTSSSRTMTETGSHWVEVYNKCESISDTININYLSINTLFIPNVITPNGDNLNDKFVVDSRLSFPSLSVFNRWGELVHFYKKYLNDWEADNLDSGTYYYLIKDECIQKGITGWIHVMK